MGEKLESFGVFFCSYLCMWHKVVLFSWSVFWRYNFENCHMHLEFLTEEPPTGNDTGSILSAEI